MLKPGDKLVCVDDSNLSSRIKLYNIYTFVDYEFNYKTYNYNAILIKENYIVWRLDRFVTLKDYRKQKLEKLCSK